MVRILAHVDQTRRTTLHARLRASNTAASPALARLRDSADDDEVPLHVWALRDNADVEEEEDLSELSSVPSAPTRTDTFDLPALAVSATLHPPEPPHSHRPRSQHATGSLDQTHLPPPQGLPHASPTPTPPPPPPSEAAPSMDNDDLLGGLVGHTWAQWLHVTYLYVVPSARGTGLGRTLLEDAERIARERGCVGSIVQTWDFQAPEFYIANGYEVKGKVEGYPPGVTDYTLIKRFEDDVGTMRGSLGVSDV